MFQAQVADTFAGQKRARSGTKGESDWECPNCGNVNFAFRQTCNMRKCSAPKPADISQALPVGGSMFDPSLQSQFLNGQIPQPIALQSFAPQAAYAAPPQYVAIQQQPYGAAPPLYHPQGSYLSAPPTGLISADGFAAYGVAPPVGVGPQFAAAMNRGPAMGFDERGQGFALDGPRKRRAGPNEVGEGDWTCPNCGNVNFAFRTHCNMRKCSEPKPAMAGGVPPYLGGGVQQPFKQQQPFDGARGPPRASATPPEGSWTCSGCGNVNYPFRTHCNRTNCRLERPAAPAAAPAPETVA